MGTAVGSLQVVFLLVSSRLRDDFSIQANYVEEENKKEYLRRMQLVSSVLFVIENITIILLFYFTLFPHTWYSFICVSLFAVPGAIMRLTHFNC